MPSLSYLLSTICDLRKPTQNLGVFSNEYTFFFVGEKKSKMARTLIFSVVCAQLWPARAFNVGLQLGSGHAWWSQKQHIKAAATCRCLNTKVQGEGSSNGDPYEAALVDYESRKLYGATPKLFELDHMANMFAKERLDLAPKYQVFTTHL